jgi:carbon starvation protein CstA
MFIVALFLLQIDFGIVWRYFGWANQTLATIVLWTISVYLAQKRTWYIISLVPALFMTNVVTTYILTVPEGAGITFKASFFFSIFFTFALLLCFLWKARK